MATTHNFATSHSNSAPFVQLQQSFASRTAAISPFIDQLMHFIKRLMGKVGITKESEEELEIALHEALANAVIHGNHENPEKQVHVTCHCSIHGEVSISVRDEGEGFDSRTVPDPTEASRLLLTHGRGLYLMRTLMDEVSFEQNGTVVRIRKRIKTRNPRRLP
jgi:serine/threonine-protein kinase RsbW